MTYLFLILVVVVVAFAAGAIFGAPWVPAFKKDLGKVLDDSGLKNGQVFYELGCGEGRLLVVAAKRGANVVGYEINPFLWLISWLRVFRFKNARVVLGDFWRVDVSDADVVLAFLVPRYMAKMETKLAKEMKPGGKFVSYVFELPHKKPKIKRHHWQVYEY